MHSCHSCFAVQWNLTIEDTIGTQLAVLYRQPAGSNSEICTQVYMWLMLGLQTVSSLHMSGVPYLECPS